MNIFIVYENHSQKIADSIGKLKLFSQIRKIRRKKYFKSKVKEIYADNSFEDVEIAGELPEDTSKIFFILKKKATRAIYFDSFGKGIDTYRLLFASLKDFHISTDILSKVINIFR